MKYASLQAHQDEFSICLMCRVLQVSRSGYYDWLKRGLRKRTAEEQRLRVEIRSITRRSGRTYGSPRLHEQLRLQETRCSRKLAAVASV